MEEQEQLVEHCQKSLRLQGHLYETAAEEGLVVLIVVLAGFENRMSKAVVDVDVDWVHVHTYNGLHQVLAQQLHYQTNHKLVAARVAVAVAVGDDAVAVVAATTNIHVPATVAAAVAVAGGSVAILPFYAD
jgi:lysylphosphatidylglycerol synthetase-like protein (DUF2156 family)